MRQATIYYKKEAAGVLTQLDTGAFVFRYNDRWFHNSNAPSISLTLPKSKQEYHSNYLFPFFFNMLPEGSNKQTACYELKIDATDYFGLLLSTAAIDTIGAVLVKKI